MNRLLMLITIAATMALAGCEAADRCYGHYVSCTSDRKCHLPDHPYGKCIDDGVTGRVCAVYHFTCPTNLRFSECAGVGDKKSPLAGFCVRPEYLPDAGADGGPSSVDAGADFGVEFDGPGPS